jgi:hypothetical protein
MKPIAVKWHSSATQLLQQMPQTTQIAEHFRLCHRVSGSWHSHSVVAQFSLLPVHPRHDAVRRMAQREDRQMLTASPGGCSGNAWSIGTCRPGALAARPS